MKARSEGDEMAQNTAWRGTQGAQAYFAVRRAPGASTRRVLWQIGGRSSAFMNSLG